MLFAACWGRETSRVMKSQGPGVLSGECYKTLALCWWCRSDLTEDMLTHYMLYLPFIRGHRRTYSRVISIIFICCMLNLLSAYLQNPPSNTKISIHRVPSILGASFFSHWDKWTKMDNVISTMEQEMFNYPYYLQRISCFYVFRITQQRLLFKFPTLHWHSKWHTGRYALWGRLSCGFLPSRVQCNAHNVIFFFLCHAH